MEFVSFRFPEKNKRTAEWLAELEGRKTSDEYREIFVAGIDQKRKQVALSKYTKGTVSIGKAAEIAGVTIWEFLDLMKEKNISLNLTTDEILAATSRI